MSHPSQSVQTLYVREATDYRPATYDELIHVVQRTLSYRFRRGNVLDSPDLVRRYLQLQMADLEHEVFGMLALDTRHRLIAHLELFRGTIDGSSAIPGGS